MPKRDRLTCAILCVVVVCLGFVLGGCQGGATAAPVPKALKTPPRLTAALLCGKWDYGWGLCQGKGGWVQFDADGNYGSQVEEGGTFYFGTWELDGDRLTLRERAQFGGCQPGQHEVVFVVTLAPEPGGAVRGRWDFRSDLERRDTAEREGWPVPLPMPDANPVALTNRRGK